MKKFLLFALPLFLFSCKSGVEAHKDAITKLGTDWDATTKSVTGIVEGLTSDAMGLATQGSAMMLDSVATKALKGDAGTKYTAALDMFKKATGAYAPVQEEINGFVASWTEKAGVVTALKDGLAAGKFEGDIPTQIADLTSMITQGTEKVTALTAKKTELKTAADSALGALKTAYEAIAPKK
jgi:hypothetical protein